MEKFRLIKDIRIFELKRKEFIEKKQNYKFILFETVEYNSIEFDNTIGVYNNPYSLFLIHHLDKLYSLGINQTISKNYVFSLAD